jgi:hypothetical protein
MPRFPGCARIADSNHERNSRTMAGIKGTTKEKPYTVLTVVQSESGSWSYEIRTSHRDGVTYCTCRGFIFHKKCKHMDAYLANPTVKAAAPVPTFAPDKTLTQHQRQFPSAVLRQRLTDKLRQMGFYPEPSQVQALITITDQFYGRMEPVAALVAAGPGLNAEGVRIITLPD